MAALEYTQRPISDRTWLRPAAERISSPFRTTWAQTQQQLARELDAIGGRRVVLEIDVREQDLRIDGQVRANVRPASDAVVLAFESQHGPLQYRSDLYDTARWWRSGQTFNAPAWQHNVRAIAATLEALRAVDRYGATSRGEQYRGFRAIGAGNGTAPSSMTLELAYEIIAREARPRDDGPQPVALAQRIRVARAETHPDRNGGDRSRWDAVEQAVQVLRRCGRIE